VIKPNILFEDKYLMVVEKPAGLLSYPLPGSDEQTVGSVLGATPAHRLDRDTTGIIVLAKNEEIKSLIQKQFAERTVVKEYMTLVWGELTPPIGEITIPLGRGAKERLKIVPSSTGRVAHTTYRVIKYFPKDDVSLVRVGLKTGRTHQIRVHMSAIGHPVVGDPKYSNKKTTLGRQFLHAAHIVFEHPVTGKKLDIKSELPVDLVEYQSSLL
jgi:23S rRNA pseudouridine1911/1915/1917 synthase